MDINLAQFFSNKPVFENREIIKNIPVRQIEILWFVE